MSSPDSPARRAGLVESAKSAFDWWLEELRLLFSGGTFSEKGPPPSSVWLTCSEQTLSARLVDGDTEQLLGPIRLDALGGDDSSERLVTACRGAARVWVLIDDRDAITTTLRLPRATEENLRTVLGFEMDRHTPFESGSVHFGYEIVGRDEKSIKVELVVVQKTTTAPLFDALQAAGIRPDIVTVAKDAAAAGRSLDTRNLLPADWVRSVADSATRSTAWQWRAAAALAIAVFAFPVAALSIYNSRLEQELASVQEASAEVLVNREKLLEILGPARFFGRLRAETPRVIEIVDDLSKLMPNGTWVSSLRIEGEKVQFDGESSDAAGLIGLIESSSFFSDSKFISPVTRNESTGKDRYSIEARIARGGDDG